MVAKIPKPKVSTDTTSDNVTAENGVPLPQTLVRIPIEHAPNVQQHTDSAIDSA